MGILKRIQNFYWEHIASPYSMARHRGVIFGKNCLIATRNFSSEGYLITIGDNVQLTKGVSIHTHGGCHAIRNRFPDFDAFGKVVIEDWVYVGSYSQIMPGVTIGYGSIVAAGSIVTKSVPPYSIVGGNPARVIGTIDEFISKNAGFDLHCKGFDENSKKRFLLSLDDSSFIKK